jgi:hypothetical protein
MELIRLLTLFEWLNYVEQLSKNNKVTLNVFEIQQLCQLILIYNHDIIKAFNP